tara:strand:- start:1189 stop:1947 length:759 start_codon:yes stop_codon:yes gene_type:complete
MAPFGGIGKFFGIDKQEAAQIAGSFATGGIGSAIGTAIASIGDGPQMLGKPQPSVGPPNTQFVDVAPPTAGVDSPATLTEVSQTSMIPQNDVNQAFIGGFGVPGALIGAGKIAKNIFTKPGVGGALTGVGAGLGIDAVTDMFGNTKKLVITRKLQRDVKKVFMMSGGDLGFVSANSMMLFGKTLTQGQILQVLFKTFKNQGPYVTKAAVRKTRSTIRKMETLCDLKDRLCPPKPARRRPAARRMSTSITQVK